MITLLLSLLCLLLHSYHLLLLIVVVVVVFGVVVVVLLLFLLPPPLLPVLVLPLLIVVLSPPSPPLFLLLLLLYFSSCLLFFICCIYYSINFLLSSLFYRVADPLFTTHISLSTSTSLSHHVSLNFATVDLCNELSHSHSFCLSLLWVNPMFSTYILFKLESYHSSIFIRNQLSPFNSTAITQRKASLYSPASSQIYINVALSQEKDNVES